MSQPETNLRRDQLTLYPMHFELSQEEQLRLKGGLVLWLLAMAVPIFLLVELRYVLAGGYVDPSANPLLGGIGLVLLVVTAILTSVAKHAGKPENRRKISANYGWAFVFALAAFIVIGWHVADGSASTLTHWGMMYLTGAGVADFYVLCLLITLLATQGRVKRLPLQNTWGLSATSYFTWFVVAVWIVMYVFLYFL